MEIDGGDVMTVDDILEQVKLLSPQDRRELAWRLLAMAAEPITEEISWTDEEIESLLTVEPMTGQAIVEAGLTGGWRDLNIPDGALWVEARRRKRRERRQW